jgi:hypothetical protein
VSPRRARRAALVVIGTGLVVLGWSTPAGAHGVGGIEPTNFETTVRGVTPSIPGVTVGTVDIGEKIELRNEGRAEVVVIGYEREPYLRVGPGGVWENRNSPAVFLNRTLRPDRAAPARYDADAAPEWRKVSSDPVARWHDHRAHWMDRTDPPAVARAPGERHVVIEDWAIPLRVEGTRHEIRGDVVWVPGPSPWPWLALAGALGIGLVALSRTRLWAGAIAIALAVLIVSESVHLIGSWNASTEGVSARFGASIYSIGGIAMSVLALVWLRRRDPWSATPAVLIAGLFMLVAGGLADLTTVTRSQVPTTLPPALARLTVALALGLGAGLVVAAALRLRAPRPARELAAD